MNILSDILPHIFICTSNKNNQLCFFILHVFRCIDGYFGISGLYIVFAIQSYIDLRYRGLFYAFIFTLSLAAYLTNIWKENTVNSLDSLDCAQQQQQYISVMPSNTCTLHVSVSYNSGNHPIKTDRRSPSWWKWLYIVHVSELCHFYM